MDWKYVKPITEDKIELVEAKFNIKLSQELKEIILKYNGGRPEKKCFNTQIENGKLLKGFLSYDKEDKDNIYIYTEIFDKEYIPFAVTEFGDVVCMDKSKIIYLYMHELDRFVFVANSIKEFVKILY